MLFNVYIYVCTVVCKILTSIDLFKNKLTFPNTYWYWIFTIPFLLFFKITFFDDANYHGMYSKFHISELESDSSYKT